MKPFDILSSLPQWSGLGHDAIVDSPAFAMPCRLGDESATLVFGAIHPADTINLSILLEDEPHVLSLARSPRFKELDAVWDSRVDVPEPILLAIVEKDAGPLLQLVENAVRKQLKLVGLSESGSPDPSAVFAQVSDVVFALTRSNTVTSAIGNLRNLDLTHESIRSVVLPSVVNTPRSHSLRRTLPALPSETRSFCRKLGRPRRDLSLTGASPSTRMACFATTQGTLSMSWM